MIRQASLSNGRQFDAIVVGCGPAGSMTAYLLAKAGLRTALLDANVFPRTKPCGGGLQVRTLRNIPFDVTSLFRGTMRRMSVSYELDNFFTREYPEPLVHYILRSEFDLFLLERAQAAGAIWFPSTAAKGVSHAEDGTVSVATESGAEFHAQFVVGADGANSVIRGTLNQRRDYFWQAAVSCEVPLESLNASAYDPDCMIVDWGSLPSGYGWVFPKYGCVNIGAGGALVSARMLKAYVMRFVRRLNLLAQDAPAVQLVGHQLPTLTPDTRVASERILLVGDAAGAVEPFTGDGIAFAVHSARLAANSIRQAFDTPGMDASNYQADLHTHIGADLMWSRKLLSVSIAFPRLIHYLFRHNERVWRTFCRTLRGEETFYGLKKDVLGPFEFAWAFVERLTESRERRILSAKPTLPDFG